MPAKTRAKGKKPVSTLSGIQPKDNKRKRTADLDTDDKVVVKKSKIETDSGLIKTEKSITKEENTLKLVKEEKIGVKVEPSLDINKTCSAGDKTQTHKKQSSRENMFVGAHVSAAGQYLFFGKYVLLTM